ncbi:hypothetical protein XFF6166_970005 [Xanthomonas citri pv. fuscans]|nr:hypothetical protein XFF6166_970005 [Xanthomonas citri pv. fuscans]SOO00706.1 hypothetical protein XFF6960_360031 [Xanthomonas citri pv. fuscans]SOO06915.1 hypothetical protein XFF7767_830005 [Xanthomonas citri pv. fuscans]SOO07717.1 hypothetical protein XFF6970_1010030 [Xanthomonas citri pv. fuscans]SOO13169.1 hypothetical protein XFF7766_1210030 [Xanthomonas citri pv. fuscans]
MPTRRPPFVVGEHKLGKTLRQHVVFDARPHVRPQHQSEVRCQQSRALRADRIRRRDLRLAEESAGSVRHGCVVGSVRRQYGKPAGAGSTRGSGDRKITEQLNLILHDPQFQALDGAWRGLHYLVSNTESDTQLTR